MKRTKIICTIGPASDNEEKMAELAQAGMNMIRLNFSHGTYEEQLNKITICKRINEKYGWHIGMMLDTKGPEIRVGKMENDSV
ncbi:MAG TPA: pyruvate kinase, partial [Erysipelotrichaceae bacterium]|nr:pyruvate kinase [Erysipelotrichaceae bacterium]